MEAIKNIIFGLSTMVQTITVWDILDIAIIAFLIYRILSVVRRTSAGNVIKGIVLLLALMGLSSVARLNVISHLLDLTMQMGIIVLVVLFQPELRKFFEQMGSRNFSFIFGRRVKLENADSVIFDAVSACESMSKSKTGALIVFERGIGLNEYAITGTKIDSAISAELIKNVFFPNTPLHDGAMIIRNGRILAAGCMLPMSSSTNLSRDLGMRHRAGIGISERSDAVAIIVSEETGAISVAVDGMLKRHLSKDTFEKLLRSELTRETSSRETKKNDRRAKVKDNGQKNI